MVYPNIHNRLWKKQEGGRVRLLHKKKKDFWFVDPAQRAFPVRRVPRSLNTRNHSSSCSETLAPVLFLFEIQTQVNPLYGIGGVLQQLAENQTDTRVSPPGNLRIFFFDPVYIYLTSRVDSRLGSPCWYVLSLRKSLQIA